MWVLSWFIFNANSITTNISECNSLIHQSVILPFSSDKIVSGVGICKLYISIYVFTYMWVFVCLYAHVRVLWNGGHTYFYGVFCAWESESHHDAATHTSPITAWVSSSPLLASDFHVSWSVARPAISRPPPSHFSFLLEKKIKMTCWSPLRSTCVCVTSEPACLSLIVSEAFIAMCSSLQGSLVWVWDYNILFVTSSLWLFNQSQLFIISYITSSSFSLCLYTLWSLISSVNILETFTGSVNCPCQGHFRAFILVMQ